MYQNHLIIAEIGYKFVLRHFVGKIEHMHVMTLLFSQNSWFCNKDKMKGANHFKVILESLT